MTLRDTILIRKAWKTIDFQEVEKLMQQAESDEAKEQLRHIRNYRYEQDKVKANCN